MSDNDYSNPHPNICHWSFGLPGLCGRATKYSAYFNPPGRRDLIANLCEEHAERALAEKIDCTVRNRWTGETMEVQGK